MTSVAAAWAEEAEASHWHSTEDTSQGPHLATPGLASPPPQPLPAHGTQGGHAHILEAWTSPVFGDLCPLLHEAPAVKELAVGGQSGAVEVREAGVQQAPPDLTVSYGLDLSFSS